MGILRSKEGLYFFIYSKEERSFISPLGIIRSLRRSPDYRIPRQGPWS